MNLLIHPQTKSRLSKFIENPSHALALNGEPGSGKRTLAEYTTDEILCVKTENYPYFKALDASNKVGIDEIRELQAFLNLKVPGNKSFRRAVVIENLDNLRHEAQNALLKTIEEPPADTIIVVTYSLPSKVLTTLHSRMQGIKVLPLDLSTAEQALGGDFNQKLIRQSYYMSGGLPGLMCSLLLEEKSHPLIKAVSEAKNILGMSRFERLNYVDKVLKHKEVTTSTLLDGLYRLLDASYKQSLDKRKTDDLKPFCVRLRLIEQAIRDLQEKVQAKLVLSRLFTEL